MSRDGRDLDREIAEKVMDYDTQKVWTDDFGNRRSWRDENWINYIPRFSENLVDAFQVVEKMREMGWYFSIQNCHSPEYDWCCVISSNDLNKELGEGMDKSLPMAICLASLKVMGAIKNESVE
jgi:hypothetical protein